MKPILFVDTNWLVASYLRTGPRGPIVEQFARQHDFAWVCSRLVFVEAFNVFARLTAKQQSPEWQRLTDDIGKRLLVAEAPWDLLEVRALALCRRYSHKARVGTADLLVLAAAMMIGATHFLSFDATAKALAAAERLTVFPALTNQEKGTLAELRR